jgi:hypothetical protein
MALSTNDGAPVILMAHIPDSGIGWTEPRDVSVSEILGKVREGERIAFVLSNGFFGEVSDSGMLLKGPPDQLSVFLPQTREAAAAR